jgi:hypothetical protein
MKRLNITNFTKKLMEIYSDFFMIKHCSEDRDKYLIGIEVRDVVSFKPLKPKFYKMAIYKDKSTDSLLEAYELKLWDMGENITYPMSIWTDNLKSTTLFTIFLNSTLKMADRGEFSGNKGNEIG